jgi:hypothetical protein
MLVLVLKCGAKLLVLREGGYHAPSLTLPCFAAGISPARDKVTGEIIQADDLLAFAAN